MAIPILRLLPIAWFILEVVVLVEVGQAIGALATAGLLLGAIVLGGFILRHAGMNVVSSLMMQAQPGRPPMERLRSAGWQVVAGLLLIIPGFTSDVLALLLFLPPVRRLLGRMMPRPDGRDRQTKVIEGEVLDITLEPDGGRAGLRDPFGFRDEGNPDPRGLSETDKPDSTNPWSPRGRS